MEVCFHCESKLERWAHGVGAGVRVHAQPGPLAIHICWRVVAVVAAILFTVVLVFLLTTPLVSYLCGHIR